MSPACSGCKSGPPAAMGVIPMFSSVQTNRDKEQNKPEFDFKRGRCENTVSFWVFLCMHFFPCF